MMHEPSKVKFAKYENVYKNLKVILNEFLEKYDGRRIIKINLNQSKFNEGTFSNNLIEDDFDSVEIIQAIKDSYLSRDYIQGEIGLIDAEEQYDGIFNSTLYMLMSNRLAKYYKKELDNNINLDAETREKYEDKYKNLLNKKLDATTKLMYSLYIYKETENDNDFYYGHRIDNYGKDTFVIDLPVYGQISVHFGSKQNLEQVKNIARQSATKIIERKLELGQISQEKYGQIINDLNENTIFPEYTGKLYEYSSAIPLDYCGTKYEQAQKDLKISKKNSNNLTNEDIKRISENSKYNSRELYYFAVKSDWTKSQLELLSKNLQERDIIKSKPKIDINELGNEAINLTTAEERKAVKQHERIIQNTQEREI